MSQLSEVYKTYSVTALLRIIENPENYRPEAREDRPGRTRCPRSYPR